VLIDKEKSLKELGFTELSAGNPETPLIEKVLRLCDKPLHLLSVEDLRLMIGQNVALKFLVPVAIDVLEENPFVSGDYYYGDLLQAVLSIEFSFWRDNPSLYRQVSEIVTGLVSIMENLTCQIETFEKLDRFFYTSPSPS
jgi:hypothetical protein